MTGPCLDPTCECCTAWRQLDDQRVDDIDRLNRELADVQAFMDRGIAPGWTVIYPTHREERET